MSTRTCVAIIVFLTACGEGSSGPVDADAEVTDGPSADPDGSTGDDGDPTEYTSGDRIKARVLTTPDGAKALAGWRDTQLGIDCTFSTASDGTHRCLPVFSATVGNYFSDTQCTVPLAAAVNSNRCLFGEPTYAYRPKVISGGTCTGTHDLLPIQNEVQPTEIYLENGQGECNAQPPSPAFTYYSVGSAVSPSVFQSGTESVEQ